MLVYLTTSLFPNREPETEERNMNTRSYEALYILPASLDDEAVDKNVAKYKKFIEDQGGAVDKAEKWEKRKLAYSIKGHSEGNYCILQFSAPANVPAELSRLFRINDEIIRGRIFLREE
jgi:small subunit ribosomal protein S6